MILRCKVEMKSTHTRLTDNGMLITNLNEAEMVTGADVLYENNTTATEPSASGRAQISESPPWNGKQAQDSNSLLLLLFGKLTMMTSQKL